MVRRKSRTSRVQKRARTSRVKRRSRVSRGQKRARVQKRSKILRVSRGQKRARVQKRSKISRGQKRTRALRVSRGQKRSRTLRKKQIAGSTVGEISTDETFGDSLGLSPRTFEEIKKWDPENVMRAVVPLTPGSQANKPSPPAESPSPPAMDSRQAKQGRILYNMLTAWVGEYAPWMAKYYEDPAGGMTLESLQNGSTSETWKTPKNYGILYKYYIDPHTGLRNVSNAGDRENPPISHQAWQKIKSAGLQRFARGREESFNRDRAAQQIPNEWTFFANYFLLGNFGEEVKSEYFKQLAAEEKVKKAAARRKKEEAKEKKQRQSEDF